MKITHTIRNHILAGNYQLLDQLIAERFALLDACYKAMTCQSSMNSAVVEIIRKAIKQAQS